MTTRPTARAGEWHPAFEEYCEAIFELDEDDLDVIQARIADRLEVSRPAVSEMIRKMEANDLVSVGGGITLTTKGRAMAEQIVRRHRLAERFLTDVLHLSWADAHREAGKWEHIISPVVEAAIVSMLDEPTTCPHGNPIPGTEYDPGETRQLKSLDVGDRFTIARIPKSSSSPRASWTSSNKAVSCPAEQARSSRHHRMAPTPSPSMVEQSGSARSQANASSSAAD